MKNNPIKEWIFNNYGKSQLTEDWYEEIKKEAVLHCIKNRRAFNKDGMGKVYLLNKKGKVVGIRKANMQIDSMFKRFDKPGLIFAWVYVFSAILFVIIISFLIWMY